MPWTNPATWNVGDKVLAAKMNTHVRDNLIAVGPDIARVRKTADEIVNNSTALQADDILTFAVAASEAWRFQLLLFISSNSTADFKLSIREPTSATTRWAALSSVGGTASMTTPATSGGDANPQNIAVNGTTAETVIVEGFITNSTTAGSITLAWAQQTATVVDTKVLAGSSLIAHRIA